MKKIMTILLSVLLVFMTTSTRVFANDGTAYDGTSSTSTNSFDVSSSITKEDGVIDGTKVYQVKVSWSMTPGIYSSSGDIYHWNPESLKYERVTTNSTLTESSKANVTITLENRSNASVNYTISYEAVKDSESNAISISSTTQGSTSGTLSSAAPATLSLEGSPEASNSGTATSSTYKADISFNSYAKSATSSSGMNMGTYTITITGKSSFKILSYTSVSDTYELTSTDSFEVDSGMSLAEFVASTYNTGITSEHTLLVSDGSKIYIGEENKHYLKKTNGVDGSNVSPSTVIKDGATYYMFLN